MEFETENRGLDHGVWGVLCSSPLQMVHGLGANGAVPFKVAFEGQSKFPIVQVSLPGDGSPVSAAKLGKALAPLR